MPKEGAGFYTKGEITMKKDADPDYKNKLLCNFCFDLKPKTYSLYKVIIHTDRGIYSMGLLKFLELMSEWAMKKMYHISASQILLMRPDLVNEFIKKFKPMDKLYTWFFKEHTICESCFEQYKEHIPER